MSELQIILPPRDEDFLSEGLRMLTKAICDAHPELEGGYGLGGEYGYGENFENDVFVMRRFYWGDCDCGYDQREYEWAKSNKHADDCYQAELRRRRIATGMWETKADDMFEWWKVDANYAERERLESAIFDDLCNKHNLDRKFGAAVHCTCDHEPKWQAFCATPEGGHYPTCSVVLPNFRHKASGFEVRWYKWIGRDNETMNDPPDIGTVLSECITSLVPSPDGDSNA